MRATRMVHETEKSEQLKSSDARATKIPKQMLEYDEGQKLIRAVSLLPLFPFYFPGSDGKPGKRCWENKAGLSKADTDTDTQA